MIQLNWLESLLKFTLFYLLVRFPNKSIEAEAYGWKQDRAYVCCAKMHSGQQQGGILWATATRKNR